MTSAAMQQPLPALEDLKVLNLYSNYSETAPVVSDSFLGGSAPQLRSLSLFHTIPFPGLPKLLLSATHLINLQLVNILHSGYISPEKMVACLSGLTSLGNLAFDFDSPQSRPDRRSRRPPPSTRTLLPALTRLEFKGVCEYLEDLVAVARIDAPLLHNLGVTFFHQLILDTPQLAQFISRTPIFENASEVRLEISQGIAEATFLSRSPYRELRLRISCQQLDWQLSFLTQICTSSFFQALIPAVNDLYILDRYPVPLWQDDIEGSEWLDLLRPFTAVENLYISKKFVPHIAPALQELVGERATEALPALQTLFLKVSPGQAIEQFVATRQLSSHPISVSYWESVYIDDPFSDEEEDGSSGELPAWQLSYLAQVCTLSFPQDLINLILEVKNVHILEYGFQPPDWQDTIETSQWLELIRPFTAVKDRYISRRSSPCHV